MGKAKPQYLKRVSDASTEDDPLPATNRSLEPWEAPRFPDAENKSPRPPPFPTAGTPPILAPQQDPVVPFRPRVPSIATSTLSARQPLSEYSDLAPDKGPPRWPDSPPPSGIGSVPPHHLLFPSESATQSRERQNTFRRRSAGTQSWPSPPPSISESDHTPQPPDTRRRRHISASRVHREVIPPEPLPPCQPFSISVPEDAIVDDSELDSRLLCGICCGLDANAQMTNCGNGHLFCFDCISAWLEKQETCPMCLKSVIADQIAPPPRPLRRALLNIIVRCPYCNFDSDDWAGPLGAISEHWQNGCRCPRTRCDFFVVGCSEECNPGLLSRHLYRASRQHVHQMRARLEAEEREKEAISRELQQMERQMIDSNSTKATTGEALRPDRKVIPDELSTVPTRAFRTPSVCPPPKSRLVLDGVPWLEAILAGGGWKESELGVLRMLRADGSITMGRLVTPGTLHSTEVAHSGPAIALQTVDGDHEVLHLLVGPKLRLDIPKKLTAPDNPKGAAGICAPFLVCGASTRPECATITVGGTPSVTLYTYELKEENGSLTVRNQHGVRLSRLPDSTPPTAMVLNTCKRTGSLCAVCSTDPPVGLSESPPRLLVSNSLRLFQGDDTLWRTIIPGDGLSATSVPISLTIHDDCLFVLLRQATPNPAASGVCASAGRIELRPPVVKKYRRLFLRGDKLNADTRSHVQLILERLLAEATRTYERQWLFLFRLAYLDELNDAMTEDSPSLVAAPKRQTDDRITRVPMRALHTMDTRRASDVDEDRPVFTDVSYPNLPIVLLDFWTASLDNRADLILIAIDPRWRNRELPPAWSSTLCWRQFLSAFLVFVYDGTSGSFKICNDHNWKWRYLRYYHAAKTVYGRSMGNESLGTGLMEIGNKIARQLANTPEREGQLLGGRIANIASVPERLNSLCRYLFLQCD